MGSSAFMLTQD